MSPISFARSARLGLMAAIAPAGLAAQGLVMAGPTEGNGPRATRPTLTDVVPGATCKAGRMHRTVPGSGCRVLWQTPVAVEMLDMAAFGGGITPTRTGGDFSTRSLRFRGADGREYVFRSMDKDVTQGLHPDLKNTLVDRVVQDEQCGHSHSSRRK